MSDDTLLTRLRRKLQGVQSKLAFDDWQDYPEFATKKVRFCRCKRSNQICSRVQGAHRLTDSIMYMRSLSLIHQGLGRVALLGCILGILWGVHFVGWIQLTLHLTGLILLPDSVTSFVGAARVQLLWQLCAYGTALCTFHLAEFFTTAIWNPAAVTADSFLVNHSTGYTAAALTSWTEFLLRFILFPNWNSVTISILGLSIVCIGQTLRSLAMITAAQSFNHLIQLNKKESHVLITHGIYRVLRHPSYVGFFWWSVSTQLLLGNLLHSILFAAVSWSFFNRRIPFEEESLCKLFPDEYPQYVAVSWTGIPLIRTQVVYDNKPSPKQD